MPDVTVHPRLWVVNDLRTVMTDETEDPPSTLESFMRDRWRAVGGKRGVRGMCAQMGVTPETVYAWWRGDNEPRMDSILEIARVLQVTRAEVVAAIDGFDWSEVRRRQVAEEVEAAVAPIRGLLHELGLLPVATTPDEAVPVVQTGKGRVA